MASLTGAARIENALLMAEVLREKGGKAR